MANLETRPYWSETVRQIEPGDKVIGGANAPINLCLGDLADRTEWLKKELVVAIANIENTKFDKVGGTATGQIAVQYTAEHVGFSARNPTEGKHGYYDVQVGGYNRGGFAILGAGNGEYRAQILVTAPGEVAQDRRTVGMEIGHNEIATQAYGKLHEAFVRASANVAQTISGDKTFTGTVQVTAPAADANNDQVPTTAWVRGNAAPSGEIAFFARNSAPTGWLKANGAAVSRTTYAALFAAIGTTFGAGDGSTTFNLPDLRGEFVRCWDDGRGIDTGRAFGAHQGDAIRNIVGQFVSDDFNSSARLSADNTGVFRSEVRQGEHYDAHSDITGGAGGKHAITFDASRSVPTANENRPRNIALLACIKI